MLTKNIKTIAAALALFTMQACEKTVDLVPSDSINEGNVFQTAADLEQGLLGVYGSWNGENGMYINAIVSDETKISNENRGQGQFEFKWQYVPSQGGSASSGWTNFYYTIGLANKVLAAMDKVNATTAADIAKKDLVKAQLLALRGMAHFELLQRFTGKYNPSAKGIPYTVTSDIAARPSRASVADVVKGIEADLAAAKVTALPAAPAVTGTAGTILLSRSVVAGYQARLALFKGEWSAASNFATEAINNSGKTLAPAALFPSIWTDETEAEVMWKQRRSGTGVGTLWQDNNGDVFFEPSDKLKALFNRTTDVRFKTYFLVNPASQDTCLVNKFYASPRGPKIVDVKAMRVAEMYLIRAEGKAEAGDLAGAAADYNTLRAARITGYVNETFSSKDVAIAAIYEERARELCFEGFRFFDHLRRGISISRLASDVQSSSWQNLAASDFRMLFPIPQSSILANSNMEQNPGY